MRRWFAFYATQSADWPPPLIAFVAGSSAAFLGGEQRLRGDRPDILVSALDPVRHPKHGVPFSGRCFVLRE